MATKKPPPVAVPAGVPNACTSVEPVQDRHIDRTPVVDVELATALEQARARWGGKAIVCEERVLGADGRDAIVRFVGRLHDAFAWACLGSGPTWAAAFAEADAGEGR